MHSVSTYTAGYLYRKLSYDAARAFAPIINCTVNPFYLVSASTLPVRNVADLVALARRRPNELTYGTVGMGSGAHLATEMFNAAAGIKTVAVAPKARCLRGRACFREVVFAINILDAQLFVKQGKRARWQ
jgi:tripartite-type tricarboxylate transporter receptor subunit TctC